MTAMDNQNELFTLVQALCSASGVSGEESGAGAAVLGLLGAGSGAGIDSQGSVLYPLYQNPDKTAPHLMLEAHLDEIGMMASRVDDNGFVHIAPCGGLDRRLLMGLEVLVHAQKAPEPLPGIQSACPADSDKTPKTSELFVDVGLCAQRAKALICPGDRITTVSPARQLLGTRVSSKALDNRAGCAVLLRAAQLLQGETLPCSVTLAFCSQEETGGTGAKTAAFRVNPTHALAVDVSFAYTPDAPRDECGDLGAGAMIGIAPILDNASVQLLRRLACQHEIPHQLEVLGSSTGTDADSIAPCRCGVKTSLVSVPLKYMHTPIEVVDLEDIESCAQLLAQFARNLGADPTDKEACRHG